jgi:hypothetical protein
MFLKIVSTAKARCSTDQRSMATEMLWVSLEGRTRTNSPRQRFHSQLCYQIVRYLRRPLYYNILLWDHRCICGPSLTETSLCGAWLYLLRVRISLPTHAV